MAPISPTIAFIDADFNGSPTSNSQNIVDLAFSSLELDNRVDPHSLIERRDTSTPALSPIEEHDLGTRTENVLGRRAGPTVNPAAGVTPPQAFNNAGMLALFAIIGVAMVIASMWFFFWAKNGGFRYREGDWDDYKSTVLRRKGPDGKTLSNATKSTKLGGSTIAGTQHYKWQKQAAKSVVGYDEKGRKGVRGKRGFANTHSVLYSDDYQTETFGTQTVSDMTETRTEPDYSAHSKRYRDRDVQQYKKERPARVGGLNRVADGSHFEGSEAMSEAEQPMLQKDRNKATEKQRAERRAREEAAKMERRWKKEAEEAAASLARENRARAPAPPKKAATPASRPNPNAHKQRSASRSASPKKRDFSYGAGPESEVLSTAYTGTTTNRTASYYEEYRPRWTENPKYDVERERRSRQSSPKKAASRPRGGNGYRRGADSDLE